MDNILDLKFQSGDLNREITVREFFHELLKTLWIEGESFSGKRPFGNSGWDGDLAKCLIQNNIIYGVLDEHGYIHKCDWAKFHAVVIEKIIAQIFESKTYGEERR